jgi:hypothetical protein
LAAYAFVDALIDIPLDILPVVFTSFATGLLNELAERLSEIGNVEAGTEFANLEI